ncbi:TrbI/VirB10 family protein [Tateyamaria pelophila]|uniref:TrbI/VirB10 family protein n=1 Tax=Tateyamaria pelophila TaxID=328415 RepID=UPI001CBB1231|nr:TrbI/VirB10 family protein [Tateyamaria pelophila]
MLNTSDSREFPRDANDGLRPVIAPDFTPTERGPSDAEQALRSRVAELERILEDARSQTPSAPIVDTERLEQLQAQLDGLTSDMESREAEMSSLADERDKLRRDLRRKQSELEGMEMRLQQADDASLEEQRLAEEQEQRRQELERRRAEAQAILEAQINSPINGLSGGSGDDDEREYKGDEAFVRSGAGRIVATQSRVIGAPSNTVIQGTVIEATLTTGINSELSGTINSTVSHDIWSFDMHQVLIPRGSQMFGRYSNGVALGQRRVLVAWDRLVTPDGQVVDLDAYGSDRLGRSGLTGKVNTRFGQRFGAAALISIFGALPAIAASRTEDDETQVVIENVGADAGDNASAVVEEYLRLAPIITVEHGDIIMVMVTNDLELF